MNTVKRSQIPNCPESATMALYNLDNQTIGLFYRYIDVIYNDKSTAKVLQYESFSGVWFVANSKNIESNPQIKLIVD